jgi:predicted transcriptional regulator
MKQTAAEPLTATFEAKPWRLTSRLSLSENARSMKAPRFLLRGFRRPREVASLALGKLERQVLEEAWKRAEVSVRDIYLAFEERIAYTTLMTTLDRLYKKRILERRKNGRAFLYSPTVSREQFEHGIREDVIDGLLGHGAEGVQPVLACIVDTVTERDRELLDELERLVREKKRELKRKSE